MLNGLGQGFNIDDFITPWFKLQSLPHTMIRENML